MIPEGVSRKSTTARMQSSLIFQICQNETSRLVFLGPGGWFPLCLLPK
jgi:hypothetical protein